MAKIDIELKAMTSELIPGLVKVENESFSKPWTKEGFEAELENDTANFTAAVYNGQAVGYIGFHAVLDEGYVANIAVLPEYRRLGIADDLLKAALERSAEMRLSFLSLEVRKSNSAAIALYKKYGFEKVGERKRFYSAPVEDAYIMTRYFTY